MSPLSDWQAGFLFFRLSSGVKGDSAGDGKNMKNKKEKEITKDQLMVILGEDWENYQQILKSCCCSKCDKGYSSTIVDYKIFVNNLNDIILRGKCAKCGNPMNRYTETGENFEYVERIKKR